MTKAMDGNQGKTAVPAAQPAAPRAAPALRNMMDMPEALITVLLEHMSRSDLTHSDRYVPAAQVSTSMITHPRLWGPTYPTWLHI